jgi:hypothetical protein
MHRFRQDWEQKQPAEAFADATVSGRTQVGALRQARDAPNHFYPSRAVPLRHPWLGRAPAVRWLGPPSELIVAMQSPSGLVGLRYWGTEAVAVPNDDRDTAAICPIVATGTSSTGRGFSSKGTAIYSRGRMYLAIFTMTGSPRYCCGYAGAAAARQDRSRRHRLAA